MHSYVRISILGLAVLGLACAPKPAPVQTAARPAAANKLSAASLTGVARAPIALAGSQSVKDGALLGDSSKVISNDGASLIGNDGGGVISNDGASLIGNDGASLKHRAVLAADELAELPLAGAVVLARDARTQARLSYVKPAVTDAHGQFTLRGVPADVTVMVEIVFVSKAGKALRLASLAHVAPKEAKPVAVSLATTLATASLTSAASGSTGQIYLMKQADIESMATAMQAAIDKDEARKREAAQALAMPTDARGSVAVASAAPAAPLAAMAAQAEQVAKAEPEVAAVIQAKRDTLIQPVPAEFQPLVTAVDDATKGTVAIASPSPTATQVATTLPTGVIVATAVPSGIMAATASPVLAVESPAPSPVWPSPSPTPVPSPPASPNVSLDSPDPVATTVVIASPQATADVFHPILR